MTRLLLIFILFTSFSSQLIAYPRYILEWGEFGQGEGQFDGPKGIATDSNGNVYVADTKNHRMQKFDAHGRFMTTWGKNGTEEGNFNSPIAVAVDNEERIYVIERGGQRVQKFDRQGKFILSWGKNATQDFTFDTPIAIAISPKDDIYVLDAGLHQVFKFGSQGKLLGQWGDDALTAPKAIAVDLIGSVYVTDSATASIYKFTPTGDFLRDLNADRKWIEQPSALAIDPKGNVIILDTAKRSITKLGPGGQFFHSWYWEQTHKSSEKLPSPQNLAVDALSNLYLLRPANNHISKYAPTYHLEDFGVKPSELANLTVEDIQSLPPEFFNVLTQNDIRRIPPELFKDFTPLMMNYFSPKALSKLSIAQFKSIPPNVLTGLTLDNVGALPPDVINEISVDNLEYIDPNTFQKTRHLSKILTNLPSEFTPDKIRQYLPSDWEIDEQTGKLTTPVGTELMLRAFRHDDDLPPKVKVFDNLPDFNTGLSLSGDTKAGKMLDSLNRALSESGDADLALFRFSQNKRGILVAKGSEQFAGITLTFIPSVERSIQTDDSVTTGLSYDETGRFILTTPEKYQFALIPAPQDPEKLYNIFKREEIDDTEVAVGEEGDVILVTPTQVRSDDFVNYVIVFDPFLSPNPPPPDDLEPGIYFNPRSRLRANEASVGTIAYNEGTIQTIHPTVYSPATFIDLVLDIEGIEEIEYHTGGHFSVTYIGIKLNLFPTFEVKTRALEEFERVEPNIEVDADNSIVTYTVQDETNVMTFTLFINIATST